MAWLTVLGPDAEQVEYRLSGQCDSHADAQVDYRLRDGETERPVELVGTGWAEFGVESGRLLGVEQHDVVRLVMDGRHPATGRRLVEPKQAVHPRAKLAARPLVEAVRLVAEAAHLPVAEVLGNERLAARFARLERGLLRDGEAHRAPVTELAPIAEAAGIDPALLWDREELAAARAHADERVRIGNRGYDLVLNLPKSVSALYGLASPEVAAAIEEEYLAAVRETVAAVQAWAGHAQRGHHGDGHRAARIPTSGLIGSITLHRSARPVDGQAGDPHLHAHVMIANLVRGTDGRWSTVASGGRDLHRHVAAAGELVKAGLRDRLTRRLGVRWERCARSGEWELVGVPTAVRSALSRRAAQIAAVAGPGSSARTRAAARRLAETKQHTAPARARQVWRDRVIAAGADPDQVVADALDGGGPGPVPGSTPGPRPPRPLSPAAVADAVWDPETGVTAQRKTADRAQVLAAVADAVGPGLVDRVELEALADYVLADERAVPVIGGAYPRWTSADILNAERTLTHAATRGLHAGTARVDEAVAAEAISAVETERGITLSAEQRAVIKRLTTAGHAVDAVIGVAGAGKTTIMSAARAAWEAAGLRVAGAATAAVAAANLTTEAAIPSSTVASWLNRIDSGQGLSGIDVLVVDEAAMVDDRALARLITAARAAGTKVVGIGDPQQLRAIGIGGGFAAIHQAVDGLVLSEARRQRHTTDQKALAAWRAGARRTALATWAEQGRIHAPATTRKAYAAIATSWLRDRARYPDPHDAVENLLVLAARRADAAALSLLCRALARTAGHLTGPDTVFTHQDGQPLALAVGDLVKVTRNDYRSRHGAGPDVLNGYRGVVAAVDAQRGALVAWRRGRRTEQAWISPAQIHRGDLAYAYAITAASAQGLTSERCHVYGPGMDGHTLYPAMSRARERTALYLPLDALEDPAQRAAQGTPRSEAERLARALAAYAPTLNDPDDALIGPHTTPEPAGPTVSVADARAGNGPAATAAAPAIAAARAEAEAAAAAAEQLRRDLAATTARLSRIRPRLWNRHARRTLQGRVDDLQQRLAAARATHRDAASRADRLHTVALAADLATARRAEARQAVHAARKTRPSPSEIQAAFAPLPPTQPHTPRPQPVHQPTVPTAQPRPRRGLGR